MPPARGRLERLQSDDFRVRTAASRRSKRRLLGLPEEPEPQPAPIIQAQANNLYLRGDGAWQPVATYNQHTWNHWNMTYTNGTTTIANTPGVNWVWDRGTGGTVGTGTIYTQSMWTQANEKYEETQAQKRTRLWGYVTQQTRYVGSMRGAPEQFSPQQVWDRMNGQWANSGQVQAVAAFKDKLTDDQLIELQDVYQRAREEQLERDRAREVAEAQAAESARRAEVLLQSILSAEQKREWLEHRRVTEVAPSGRVWRFFPLWVGSTTLMDGEARRATLCIHPRERIPECDNIVAQIMQIRAGEENELLKLGVLHSGHFTEDELTIRRQRNVVREFLPAENGYVEAAV